MRTPDLEHGIHPDIDANTLVFYPVDEGTGTTARDVVNGRNVSRGGGVTWVSALIGKGVDIQTMTAGMTDGTTVPGTDAAALQGEWSCEVWVRPMAASQGSAIEYSDPSGVAAANRVQMSVGVTSDLKVFWRWSNAAGNVGYWGGGGTPSTGQLRAGVWQHVAVTKESDGAGTFTVKIYINGVLDNTQTTQAPPDGGTAGFWQLGTGKMGVFPGRICSAHVTTTVMTQAQIRTSWRRGVLWEDHAAAGHGVTDVKVTVQPSWSGSEIDLRDLLGFDYFQGATISSSVDEQCDSATVSLKRSVFGNQLAPLMQNSPLNRNPLPSLTAPGPASSAFFALLNLNTPLKIYAARRAAAAPPATTFTLLFRGTIDEVQWAGPTIEVSARDQGKQLLDTYIEDERVYSAASMQSVIAAIGTLEIGGGFALYTPTSPGFNMLKFKQRRESVLQAFQEIADLIGWLVRYRWDPLTSAFRLTLYDVDRDQVRYDGVITDDDYTELTSIYQNMGNIRNKVRIVHPDSSQRAVPDADGVDIFPMVTTERTDPSSITAYGTRFMEVSESSTSQINTVAEAQSLADRILSDLSDAEVFIESALGFWEVELGDKFLMQANSEHFDNEVALAILSYQHNLGDGRASTSIVAKAKPASGRQKWLTRESAPGRALPPTRLTGDASIDFGVRGALGSLATLAVRAELLKTSPTLAGASNPGFLVHPDGEAALPVGWDGGSGVWGSGGDLWFTLSGQNSGDRAMELRNVGASVTSQYMPIMGGRTYSVRVQWNGTVAGDKLQCDLVQYDGARSSISTTTLFHEVIASAGTYQVNNGVVTSAATARWAQVVLTKTVGGSIYIDRVQVNPFADQFSAQYSTPAAVSSGTFDFKPNSENFDYGGLYNNGTGDFTVNEPGIYRFSAQVELTATSTNQLTSAVVSLRKGGVNIYQTIHAPQNGNTTAALLLNTPLFALVAGDVIDITVTIPTNCTVSGWFTGGRNVLSDP